MEILPILCNLLAVITGIRAVGDGREWSFSIIDVLKGEKLAKIYIWLIASTMFSLVHLTALVTGSDSLLGSEIHTPFWMFMHSLIGLFFASAHVFVDALFEDRWLADKFLGISP